MNAHLFVLQRRMALILVLFALRAFGASPQPNLVFILADDLGWADTTLYGHTRLYETPNLERLAARGITFSRAYANSPLCSPTRASILTGQTPARHGSTAPQHHLKDVRLKASVAPRAAAGNKARGTASITRLDTGYPTLGKLIHSAGYRTAHFGKWHLGPEPYSPLEHGFEVDVPHWPGPGPAGSYVAPWKFGTFKANAPGEHIEDRMATEAAAWIRSVKDEPFYMNYWQFSVHAPFDAKRELIDRYRDQVDPADPQRCPTYAAMVQSLDDAVGTLLDTVDAVGIADRTAFIFVSDNGGNMYNEVDGVAPTSNLPLRGGKATIYEGGIRVPCIVAWPGLTEPGSRNESIIQTSDFYPTILTRLGLSLPAGHPVDGVDITPALRGEDLQRGPVFTFFPHNPPVPDWLPPSMAVHEGDWKLIRLFHQGENGAHDYRLYNLADDIGEADNLATAFPDKVIELDARMERHIQETGAVVPRPNPAFDPAQYRPERIGVPAERNRPKPKKPAEPKTAQSRRPNILIILVDDMGFSDIGPYGGEIPTPNLDALAEGGLRFSQFYNTGRCCPTRASLLTGLYAHQAGMGWMTKDQGTPGYRGHLNDRCVTIAEVLGDAGYLTAMTGKWHVGFEHGTTPWERGFHRSLNTPAGGLHFSNQTGSKGGTKLFLNGQEISRQDPRFDPPWYGTHLWTEWGIRFLDEARSEDQPFFWYLAHPAPHFPCMAPEETIAKYRGAYREGWDKLREARYARQIASGLIDPGWILEPRPAEVPAWNSLPPEGQTRYDDMMAIYAAMIEEIDTSVGNLVAALRERGQLDNTLILFLSDNGGNAEAGIQGRYAGDQPGDPHSNVFVGRCWAHLNNTPFRKYKHYNHEGGIASPLIAHWPSAIQPRPGPEGWVTTPTHLVDLMATCVDLGAAAYPKIRNGLPITPMQGRSLAPLLTGTGISSEDRPLFWEHEGNAAIRVGDRKLVRLGGRGDWELFDLKADRTEQRDLAKSRPDEALRLAEQWTAWARDAHVLPKPPPARKARQNPSRSAGNPVS